MANRLKTKDAARLMGVSEQYIRVGLQRGILPFGYAVQVSGGRYTYYISPDKFTEFTGIQVDGEGAVSNGME